MPIIKCFNDKCTDYDETTLDHCNRPLVRNVAIQQCEAAVVREDHEFTVKAPTLEIRDQRFYVDLLRGRECPSCGHGKNIRQVLCRVCYYSLPTDLRNRLYDKLGDGFEEAVDDALKWLE